MQLNDEYEHGFEEYLNAIRLKDITRDKHLLYYKHFTEMFGGFLTQKAVDSFLAQKTSPNHFAMINHLLNFLRRESGLSDSEQLEISRIVPLKPLGRKKSDVIRILTKKEIQMIVDNCKLNNQFNTDRFKLMVLFQYTSGLRITEVTSLKFSMLNYQGRKKFIEDGRDNLRYQKLFIPPEIAKGNKGSPFFVRTDVYLAYMDFLKRWKEISPTVAESILIDKKTIWSINKRKYSKMFKEQVFNTIGIRLPDSKSTHILRHSVCTHLLQEGMPLLEVRDFMRHSSLAITEKYMHLSDDNVSKELEKLG
jgi:site-specific recombinase XerD